jgi:hypothetical protein
VTSTPTVRYDEALESLVDASHRYRTVVTAVQEESSSTGALWTPIYADLLDELMREVTAAREQYAQAADEAGIDESERVHWRRFIASQNRPD